MEIRQVVRGQNTSFSPTAPTKGGAKKSAVSRPSADRLELSRQWVAAMEEQRVQTQAELLSGGKEQKKSQGILDLLDQPTAEEQELDALSKQLDVQMKCMKIAANIMKGKKVPPEDERYLMENDPDGYKLALAMRTPKKKPKEWDSVLEEEKEKTSETSGEEETASSCEASGGASDTGGDAGDAADSGE